MGFLAQNSQAEKQDQERRSSIVVRRRDPVFFFSSLHRGRRPRVSNEFCVADRSTSVTMDAGVDEAQNLLYDVLIETDLLKFQNDLSSKLQITKIEHFEHVKDSDLRNIGLSQPAIRRLLKAIKDKRSTLKKTKNLEKKFRKDSPKFLHLNRQNSSHNSEIEPTCLITREDVKLFEPLGEGSFGVVKRAIWNQGVGKKLDVAVKCLRNNEGFAEDFMGEVDRMHKLKHPNLIRLYGLVISKPLMMVVELCSGGALLDRLRHSQKPVLLLSQLLSYGMQIVEGMSYLESKSFIHRDLAARNVLLATEDEQTVKIGDFGLMRALRNNEDHYVMTGRKKVPFAWCPPESLIKRQFSPASDVWSFGVTVWEMFSFGEEPWCGYSGPEVLQKVSAGDRLVKPDACPLSIYQLLRQCWSPEPSQRPTFAALKDLLKEAEIQRGESKESQTGEGLLEITPGDKILVVDGGPESYYWFGQNMRTRKIGKFARKLVAIDNRVSSKDISNPIKGSFVHTGHGDGKGGMSWGHPNKIDDIYLRNPMPLIDFREEEKKKLQNNFDQISIPKPPKSERLSSRGNYYGGGTTASGSPTSNAFDAFDHCATSDAISFTSAVSGGATSTDESKESSKSADSWHGSPPAADPPPYNYKTYYSVVPPESKPVTDNENDRLYDQVPQDPDPFEIPSQIKDLTSSQRYSQIYSSINKRSPLSQNETANAASTSLKHSLIVGGELAVQQQTPSVSPKKSVVLSPPSPEKSVVASPTKVKASPFSNTTSTPYLFRQADVSSTSSVSMENKISPFSNTSTASYLNRESDISSASSISAIETPVFPAQNYFTYEKRTSIPPDVVPPVPTATISPQSNNMMNEFVHRQSQLSAELSTRLNLNPLPMPISNPGSSTMNPAQFNIWRLNGQVAPTNAYGPAYSGTLNSSTWNNSQFANSSAWNNSQRNIQQSSWLPSSQQCNRTFSEPDVARSSGVLQPVSARKSFGDGLDTKSSVAPKQVLDLFDPLSDKLPSDLINQVHRSVPFVSTERCGQVLKRCNLDVQSAIQELKIQKLVDMGLGDRDVCQRVLSKNGWNIEMAASAILG